MGKNRKRQTLLQFLYTNIGLLYLFINVYIFLILKYKEDLIISFVSQGASKFYISITIPKIGCVTWRN